MPSLLEAYEPVLSKIAKHVRSKLAHYHPRALRFRRVLAQRDARYDADHSVDTTSFVDLKKLSIASPNRRHAVPHIATDPEEFARAMAMLPIRHEEFTFIDLGSGKGRALLLAAKFPFRRLIGVEFARELHETAEANLLSLRNPDGTRPHFHLHCMDATEFEFPAEPLVLFLYNPFGSEIIARVAQRLLDSYSVRPRAMYVLYINPFHLEPWRALGFRTVASGDPFVILAPPSPA